MDISLIATTAKRLGAVCLALVIFWHVAQHAGPQQGKAIVHVPQTNVVVEVDDLTYRVDSIGESPVVCELGPGAHMVKVYRDGLLLGEEGFTVEPGEDVVLCPLVRPAAAPVAASREDRSVPASEAVRPTGLAVHVRKPAAVHH